MKPGYLVIENWRFWILAAIVIKLLVAIPLYFTLELYNADYPHLFGGDAHYYLTAAENILYKGTYAIYNFNESEGLEPYTGRMPGYEPVLIAWLSFLPVKKALFFVVVSQFLLSCIAAYCLGSIGKIVFKNKLMFYVIYFSYLLNTYITVFDLSILTESFAVSAFVISCFLLLKRPTSLSYLLLSGFLLCWGIFLRQYLAPFLLLFICFILYKHIFYNAYNWKRSALAVLVFFAPFLVFDGLWVIRNYSVKGTFVPLVDDLHAGYRYAERYKKLMIFVQAWGGDIVHWNPKAEIVYFKDDYNVEKGGDVNFNQSDIDLPDYIYTSTYNEDSLKQLRHYFKLIQSDTLSATEYIKYDQKIISALDVYTNSFKAEKPFYYYIYSPFKLLYNFIVHSGTYNISMKSFSEQGLGQKAYKLFYTFLYWFVWVCGMLGVLIYIIKRDITMEGLLLIGCALYMVLLCPFVLKRIEYRYLVISYPFLNVFACYFLLLTCKNIQPFIKRFRFNVRDKGFDRVHQ